MKSFLLATAATLAMSMPALAAGQGHSNAAAGSTQYNQMQQTRTQQPAAQQQSMSPSQLNEQQVRDIQQALNQQGFDAGNVDGVWGPETRNALENFQERQNLAADGNAINQETLSALGVQFASQQPLGTTGSGTPGAATTGSGTTGSGTTGSGLPSDDVGASGTGSGSPANMSNGGQSR